MSATDQKSDDLVSDLSAIDASLSLKLESLADAERRLHNLHKQQTELRKHDEHVTSLLVHAEADLSAGISGLHDNTVTLRRRTHEVTQAVDTLQLLQEEAAALTAAIADLKRREDAALAQAKAAILRVEKYFTHDMRWGGLNASLKEELLQLRRNAESLAEAKAADDDEIMCQTMETEYLQQRLATLRKESKSLKERETELSKETVRAERQSFAAQARLESEAAALEQAKAALEDLQTVVSTNSKSVKHMEERVKNARFAVFGKG